MAENELALINKVELRIALAEDDKKFEETLKLYLAPLLLKLSSPYSEVRQAILKILQYLIPRISAARTIKLPVNALLDQVKNPKISPGEGPPLVKLYSLLLLSRGIERLSAEERTDLVPKIVEDISKYPTSVSARLFNVLCKLLECWKVPERDSYKYNQMNEFLHFDNHPEDEKFLSKVISKFFLLQANSTSTPTQFPGLSTSDTSFLTQDAGVSYKTTQEIQNVKLSLLEFLKAGFQSKNLAVPLLIGSCDSSSAISDLSEVLFKKLDINLEDPILIDSLIELFLGSPDDSVPPASPILQEKILSILLKSKLASHHSQIAKLSSVALSSNYSKLKRTAVHYIKWVSKNNNACERQPSNNSFNIGMAAQLKNNIMGEGWPRLDLAGVRNYSSMINQRLLQYEALGDILKSNPSLILEDFAYLEFLFQSLEGEDADVKPTIQEALSGLTSHLPSICHESKTKLKSLAKKYLSLGEIKSKENLQSCRYIAIKYINCAFPFSDSEARILCVLGTSSANRADVVEEAHKGLHPHWFNILQSSNTLEFKATSDLLGNNSKVEFPSFSDIVFTLKNEIDQAKEQESATIYNCMGTAIQFIVQTLVMQAINGKVTVIIQDEEWLVRLEKAIEVDETVLNCLIKEIRLVSQEDLVVDDNQFLESSFNIFLSIIFDCFVNQYKVSYEMKSNIVYGLTFTKLISLSPPKVIEKLSTCLSGLLLLSDERSLGETSSVQVAKSIGIIASHPINDDSVVHELLNKLVLNERQTLASKVKLLSAGYLFSRLTLRKRVSFINDHLLVSYCEGLVEAFKSPNMLNVALECVSQLSIFGVLGPNIKPNDRIKTCVNNYIDVIQTKAKKCDEKSVLTLSYLSMISANETYNEELNEYEKLVFDTHISKQIEYLFTSGEAFTILAAGWESKVLDRHLDIQEESIQFIPKDTSRLPHILRLTLQSCNNTKPSLRKAGCIWLLSLVQYCGHLGDVRKKSPEIHLAFMRFLADRDELIQESASRGLSLVYEMGDYELKDTLVRGLLKSFTDANSPSALSSGSVGLDTELFDPDLLKTNDGSVSTYKDVLNLASDVGDPSLVYKFMSLAKSSALWSSRKGMAFGLGSILSKSSLDEMLNSNKSLANKLIPKLYRYRYDPNPSVSKSMNDIWNVLIKDSSKTIYENFSLILNELLKEMGNKEWRVRQASASALNDLLQSVSLDIYEAKLEQVWGMSFRAMDDIKESVRKEGINLTRSLATTLTRTADVKAGGSTNKATRILSNLIPFLLSSKGLLSDAEDIKKFALETIMKLSKVGGTAIKPFIPDLLDNFIGLMSSLEPEAVNYLVLNADKYNMKSNDIDAQRLQSLGHSPMMDAIEQLLERLDDSLMPLTVRVLQQSIKKSVGLPSKVCGSRILVSLVTKHLELIKPYGDQLLKICINQLNDKNDTIASSYATTAGYLGRISSIEKVTEYSSLLLKLYFESEEDRNREIAAIGSECMSKYSGDKFESALSAFLPLAFIGKHDPIKSVKQPFEREWIDNTSGNGSIKLYIEEICAVCNTYLNSNQYEIRRTIGRALVTLCNCIEDTSSFPRHITEELFNTLIESCKGKSWSGKDLILDSLISITIKSKWLIKDDIKLLDTVNKVVLTEAKRRNKEYQIQAVKLMGKYLKHLPSDELVEAYVGIMSGVLSDDYNAESDDEMCDISSRKNTVKLEEDRLLLIKNLFDTLIVPVDSRLFQLVILSSIDIFNSSIHVTWRSKVQINEDLSGLLKNLISEEEVLDNEQIESIRKCWELLEDLCLRPNDIENVKIQFVRFSKVFIVYLTKINKLHDVELVANCLAKLQKTDASPIVQSELLKPDYAA